MAKPKPAKSPRLHVDPVIGPSKQLPPSDLPLLKDVLQYCRLKKVQLNPAIPDPRVTEIRQ